MVLQVCTSGLGKGSWWPALEKIDDEVPVAVTIDEDDEVDALLPETKQSANSTEASEAKLVDTSHGRGNAGCRRISECTATVVFLEERAHEGEGNKLRGNISGADEAERRQVGEWVEQGGRSPWGRGSLSSPVDAGEGVRRRSRPSVGRTGRRPGRGKGFGPARGFKACRLTWGRPLCSFSIAFFFFNLVFLFSFSFAH